MNRKEQHNPLARDKYCYFCVNNVRDIDYKQPQLLRRFMSSYSKIVPTRRSGACKTHQRKLATAIKRARFMALVPYIPR